MKMRIWVIDDHPPLSESDQPIWIDIDLFVDITREEAQKMAMELAVQAYSGARGIASARRIPDPRKPDD